MNALTLPEALRFNEEVAPDAVRRFREEVGADVEELAALGGFERLRDFGVPEAEAFFRDFELAHFEEEDHPGTTKLGEPKHWHIFHIIAKKPAGEPR